MCTPAYDVRKKSGDLSTAKYNNHVTFPDNICFGTIEMMLIQRLAALLVQPVVLVVEYLHLASLIWKGQIKRWAVNLVIEGGWSLWNLLKSCFAWGCCSEAVLLVLVWILPRGQVLGKSKSNSSRHASIPQSSLCQSASIKEDSPDFLLSDRLPACLFVCSPPIENLPAAAGGTPLGAGTVAVLQNTRGETLSKTRRSTQIFPISSALCHPASA